MWAFWNVEKAMITPSQVPTDPMGPKTSLRGCHQKCKKPDSNPFSEGTAQVPSCTTIEQNAEVISADESHVGQAMGMAHGTETKPRWHRGLSCWQPMQGSYGTSQKPSVADLISHTLYPLHPTSLVS